MGETSADPSSAEQSKTVTDPASFGEWQSFPAEAAQVAMISGTIWGLAFGISVALFAGVPLLIRSELFGLIWGVLGLVAFVLASTVVGIWIGYRHWKYSQWKLDDTGLHAKRGRLWRKEILIPLSRVQHLDLERGPVERHFGLASLVVHTAGTRQHALRQSGFLDADAVALRDLLVPASDRQDDAL
jgi:membrane protein YdbS with pleckstrin-like domain